MGLADDLWKLEELHKSGSLTDDEYARAKASLLEGHATGEGGRLEEMSRQMGEIARRQKVADIDRAWEAERLQYTVTGTRGGTHDAQGHYVGGVPYTYVPTRANSVVMGVIVAGFGIVWTVFAAGAGGGAFALFGLIFIAFGVGSAIYAYNKAERYEEAYRAYQRRRAEALGGGADPQDTPRPDAGGPGDSRFRL
jgi:hypothetical protein